MNFHIPIDGGQLILLVIVLITLFAVLALLPKLPLDFQLHLNGGEILILLKIKEPSSRSSSD